jgi:broad specificity phosphatase PhoE
MGDRHLWLVRHGEYERDPERLDGPLHPRGVRQAEAAARRLRDEPVSTIFTSTMQRARETAAVIASEHPRARVVPMHRLRECVPALSDYHEPIFLSLFPGYDLGRLPGCRARLDSAYAQLFRRVRGTDRTEVVVGHGNALRYLMSRVLGSREDAWADMLLYHCGLSRVQVISDGRAGLYSFNETGHMRPADRTH